MRSEGVARHIRYLSDNKHLPNMNNECSPGDLQTLMFRMHLYFQAWPSAECVELTFELPDNAKECFHEIIEEGTESTLEFQV